MSDIDGLFQEQQSAWLYRVVAQSEKDPAKRQLFLQLAHRAEVQARLWETKLKDDLRTRRPFKPTHRARLVARLVRFLGPRPMRPVLAGMKIRGLSVYQSRSGPARHAMPTTVAQVGLRHKSIAGGNLRAAVFGINDGLVSNTSLIMGVAGAGEEVGLLILSGVAGLLAGALSMAAGEYVSVRSQRELFEYQIDLERAELALYPDEEAEELALIYSARGMALDEARHLTRKMIREPDHALDVLAREELGLNPEDLGSPWGAALCSFFAFTAGAAIPLMPFLAGCDRQTGITLSAGLAAASLFVVGAVLSLFTGKSAVLGGLRMLLIGAGAGIITHAIGHLWGLQTLP
jgi:VIT1/CCC1 family predicted Fe2+/Mn2+ transporter